MGPLLGGWALDRLGGRVSFALTGAVCALGALLFPLLRRSVRARVRASESSAAAGLDVGEARGGELVGERPEQALQARELVVRSGSCARGAGPLSERPEPGLAQRLDADHGDQDAAPSGRLPRLSLPANSAYDTRAEKAPYRTR